TSLYVVLFASRRQHARCYRDWSSDVCSSDLGPKIDVKLIDAIGRPWQLSTVQFDFSLPVRFGLEYVGADGRAHTPLMVHRALLRSEERRVGKEGGLRATRRASDCSDKYSHAR